MHHKHKVREQLKKAKKSKFYGKQQTFGGGGGGVFQSPLSIVITVLKLQLFFNMLVPTQRLCLALWILVNY